MRWPPHRSWRLAERMVGPERTLEAARLMTAFAHGFVSMELAGQFRFGGDVDEAYRYGVDVLVDALAGRSGAGASDRRRGQLTSLVHRTDGDAPGREGRRRQTSACCRRCRRLEPRRRPPSWSN